MKKFFITLVVVLVAVTAAYHADFLLDRPREKPSIATCDNPAAYIIPDDWRSVRMNPESDYYKGLFSDKARNRILGAPRVPTPTFVSGDAKIQAESIEKGKLLVVRGNPKMPLDLVDWSIMEYGNYYATQLHGLVGIGSILSGNETVSGEIETRIGDYIKNWAYCSAHNPEINPRAWYEGTVIKRQANLLAALNYLRSGGALGGLEYEQLIYLIDRNAEYLLDTDGVYSFGNHGIRQDMLLAATALHLPEHPRAKEMLNTAKRRLDEAAKGLFTENGIYMEHAPGYVNYALGLLLAIKEMHEFSPDFNATMILNRYDSSLDYLIKSLTPTECIPYIGMSGANRISSPIIQDLRSRSKLPLSGKLAVLSNTMHVFPNYGHAVLRGEHPDGLYLLLVAAQNLPAGKRHPDELSFLLYNFGRVWITEGGHQTYEVTGMSRYLRSPMAHNNYVLGDDFVNGMGSPELGAHLKTAQKTKDGYSVVLYSERFLAQANATRIVDVDSDFSTVAITDSLISDENGPWTGRFQLPGDLEINIDGDIVRAIDPITGIEMVVSFSTSNDLSLATCKGEYDPICGWGTVEEEFGPLTTLMWTTNGDDTVHISLNWRE